MRSFKLASQISILTMGRERGRLGLLRLKKNCSQRNGVPLIPDATSPRPSPPLRGGEGEGIASLRFGLALQIVILAMALLFGQWIHADTDVSAGTGVYPSVYGTNFTVSVPNVEHGQYTAVLGFVETEFTAPGQRLFDIEYNGKMV